MRTARRVYVVVEHIVDIPDNTPLDEVERDIMRGTEDAVRTYGDLPYVRLSFARSVWAGASSEPTSWIDSGDTNRG